MVDIVSTCFLAGFGAGAVTTVLFGLGAAVVWRFTRPLDQEKPAEYVPPVMDLSGSGTGIGVSQGALELSEEATIDEEVFQLKWTQFHLQVEDDINITSEVDIPDLLVPYNLFCIAQGSVGDGSKYYFYGEETGSGLLVLLEIISSTSEPRTIQVRVKSESPALAPMAYDLLLDALSSVIDQGV